MSRPAERDAGRRLLGRPRVVAWASHLHAPLLRRRVVPGLRGTIASMAWRHRRRRNAGYGDCVASNGLRFQRRSWRTAAQQRASVVGSGMGCAAPAGGLADLVDAVGSRHDAAQGSRQPRRASHCGMGARTDYHVHQCCGHSKVLNISAREAARNATTKRAPVAENGTTCSLTSGTGRPFATDAATARRGPRRLGHGLGLDDKPIAAVARSDRTGRV